MIKDKKKLYFWLVLLLSYYFYLYAHHVLYVKYDLPAERHKAILKEHIQIDETTPPKIKLNSTIITKT